MSARDESKLPKWAQERLEMERGLAAALQRDLADTKAAHAVLDSRRWFTIPHPNDNDEDERLFVLRRNEAVCVCTLGPGDTLLVGRKMEKVRL